MEIIRSRQNQHIKMLNDARKNKGAWADKIILEGFNFLTEISKASLKLHAVFIAEKASKRWEEAKLSQSDFPVYYLSDALFNQIASTQSPQGLLMISDKPKTSDLLERVKGKEDLRLLALENVQDPANVGTMIRTAYALAYDGVILVHNCANPFAEKAIRAAMGASLHIPLYYFEDSTNIMAILTNNEVDNYASNFNGKDLRKLDVSKKLCIWIGNEGNGLTEEVFKKAEIQFMIPMPGGAESLNAASAAAIALFHFMK